MDKNDFGGSHIHLDLYGFLMAALNPGDTILELGSGAGSTKNLSKHFQMHSIEQDPKYLDLYDSNYIHAPIVDGWFDLDPIIAIDFDYQCILVDAPVGEGNRWGFYEHMNLFNTDCLIVIDDTHRTAEMQMAVEIAEQLDRELITNENAMFSFIKSNNE